MTDSMNQLTHNIDEAAQVLHTIVQSARQKTTTFPDTVMPIAYVSALAEMQQRVRVNAHWDIGWPNWPPGIRPKLVALYQKIVRRLLSWYINPVVQQQNAFNAATLAAVRLILREVFELQKITDIRDSDQQAHLAALTAQLENVQRALEDMP